MNYVPTFINDGRMISLGIFVILICLALLGLGIAKLIKPQWWPWLNAKRLNGIGFIVGLIIGLIVAGVNNFALFDEYHVKEQWISHSIFLTMGFVNLCITLLFMGFMVALPLKLMRNVYLFSQEQSFYKKLLRLSGAYAFYGLIAIGVCLLMYPLSNTFLGSDTTSNFSAYPSPLIHDEPDKFIVKPTWFIIGTYLIINFFKIKTLAFTFWFVIIYFIALILAIVLAIWAKHSFNFNAEYIMKKIIKAADKSGPIIGIFTPVLTFSSIVACLLIQPIGTFLRLALIIILMSILFIAIYGINYVGILSTKTISSGQFFAYTKRAFNKLVIKTPLNEDILKKHLKDDSYAHLHHVEEEHLYHILVSCIFSIIIVTYLGFSAGPLHVGVYYVKQDGAYVLKHFELWQHIVFWICAYVLGYLLIFVYAFKINDGGGYRMLLSASIPWIRSGFNTGILNYLGFFVDKMAVLCTFSTYLFVGCHREKKARRSSNA